jgi:hypothetical protein
LEIRAALKILLSDDMMIDSMRFYIAVLVICILATKCSANDIECAMLTGNCVDCIGYRCVYCLDAIGTCVNPDQQSVCESFGIKTWKDSCAYLYSLRDAASVSHLR